MRRRLYAIGSGLVGVVALLSACSPLQVPPADSGVAAETPPPQPPPQTPTQPPPQSPTATAPVPVLIEQRTYVFPVDGDTTYGRVHHDYPATDIFADCGTPVVAPVSGTVRGVDRADRYTAVRDDPAVRGGRSWTLVGDDGVRYYGSHLRAIAPSVAPGVWLRAGERIGRVGASGNAAGTGCHLHFGVSPVCGGDGDWWVRRGVVAPHPYLRAWENDRHRAPVHEVRKWYRVHGCPPEPPR